MEGTSLIGQVAGVRVVVVARVSVRTVVNHGAFRTSGCKVIML